MGNEKVMGDAHMVRFNQVSYCEIETLRNEYFNSIYEAQELYLEFLVKQANYYIIKNETAVGYFAISAQDIMVEYFVTKNSIKDSERIFKTIINGFNVKKVYCKSFDSVLLKCCLNNALSYKIGGILFRDFLNTKPDAMDEFIIRRAEESDITNLLQYTDGLYESEEELYQMVRGRNILMYHLDNQLIGCGFLTKIMQNKQFYDIGMWVNSAFRKKGFATRIIAHLKSYCLGNNAVPICGCAADNLASRKTLEKNGFFSKHDLIEFEIK